MHSLQKELVSFVIPTEIKAEFNSKDCCTSGNEMEKRSVAHDPINGRSERSKAKHVTESLCPPADVCQTATGRFKLINLELPQCKN